MRHVRSFQITPEQDRLVQQWLSEEVYPTAIALQKLGQRLSEQPDAEAMWERGEPFHTSIGQEVTYSFTPIIGGILVRAIEPWTRKELDLTDYEAIQDRIEEQQQQAA